MRPASCCSLATPSLILLISSARKLTVLVVEACFSARSIIWVWREWMAANIAVMTSRLLGSCLLAPWMRSSAACGSSMDWFITCAHPSVMMWLAWPGICCCWAAALAAAEYSCGEGILSGKRAATAAPPAAARLVDKGRDERFFLPIREAVLDVGTGVGLLAWLRSKGFARVREVVWTCIGGGGGRALGVVWGSASISESDSPSSPQDACGTFVSAAHSPGGAGRIGVGDHMNGFELSGSEGLPGAGWLPDISLAGNVRSGCYHQVFLAWGHRYLNVQVEIERADSERKCTIARKTP